MNPYKCPQTIFLCAVTHPFLDTAEHMLLISIQVQSLTKPLYFLHERVRARCESNQLPQPAERLALWYQICPPTYHRVYQGEGTYERLIPRAPLLESISTLATASAGKIAAATPIMVRGKLHGDVNPYGMIFIGNMKTSYFALHGPMPDANVARKPLSY